MLPDLHTGFSRDRSGGLVFPSLSEFSTVYVIHTVKGFGIVNKAEIDVFLELSCFSNDPAAVGNLISGSSAFSKTSLNIWKFSVHVSLKPGLENFEHNFTSHRVYLGSKLYVLKNAKNILIRKLCTKCFPLYLTHCCPV